MKRNKELEIEIKRDKMKRENDNDDYGDVGASIKLEYKGQSCETGILPTSIPKLSSASQPRRLSQTIHLESMGALGNCWAGLDLSGNVEDMKIDLKIPLDSPISVSRVTVKDSKNPNQCWWARWRGSNNNKQENRFVTGTSNDFDDDC